MPSQSHGSKRLYYRQVDLDSEYAITRSQPSCRRPASKRQSTLSFSQPQPTTRPLFHRRSPLNHLSLYLTLLVVRLQRTTRLLLQSACTSKSTSRGLVPVNTASSHVQYEALVIARSHGHESMAWRLRRKARRAYGMRSFGYASCATKMIIQRH